MKESCENVSVSLQRNAFNSNEEFSIVSSYCSFKKLLRGKSWGNNGVIFHCICFKIFEEAHQ